LAALTGFALAGPAAAAGIKTIHDWTGVCDNVGDCTAFGFAPEGADNDAYVILRRAAGPAGAPTLEIVFGATDKQAAQTFRVSVDNKPVAGLASVRAQGGENGARATLGGAQAAALIAAMKNGSELELSSGGNDLVGISLSGSAGMLVWIDDQQGRVGTVTALGKPGTRPASAVPPPAAVPVVSVAPPASQAGVPQHAPKGMTKGIEDCENDSTEPDDTIARLAPGVMLWAPECEMAAYNMSTAVFVGDERGRSVKRVILPAPPGSDQTKGYGLVVNAGFDPKTQTLSQFDKGRGIGDCGVNDEWVWDGKAFQLLSETIMPECRGLLPDDWPPLYVARRR
jgi:hypothetical protein